MPQLKLQSSDGEIFQVEAQIAKQSNTIRTMLEGLYLAFLILIQSISRFSNLMTKIEIKILEIDKNRKFSGRNSLILEYSSQVYEFGKPIFSQIKDSSFSTSSNLMLQKQFFAIYRLQGANFRFQNFESLNFKQTCIHFCCHQSLLLIE